MNSDLSHVPVREGDVLAGKYRVTRVLGAGGMGVVVAAHHLQLDQQVALKFLLPAAAMNEGVRSRFLREGQAAAKIRSEHVARVLDVGTLETGAPYLVMEYLDGSDLGEVVRRGPLSVELAIDYVLQALHAIGVAHGIGIVHRDIKPANLFVTTRPDGSTCIKVLDFGISKMAGQHDMTSTGAVLGSPFYMSPEQFTSSKGVDARADIWSLGAVLFELLMGRPPFHGDSIGQLVAQVLTAPFPPLARPDAPPGLAAVLASALAKNPAERFGSVSEFAAALAPFAAARSRNSLERVAGLSRPSYAGAVSPSTPPAASPAAGFGPHGGTTPLPAMTPLPLGSGATGQRPSATGASWGTSSGGAPTRPATSRAPLFAALAVGVLIVGGGGLAVGLGIGRTPSSEKTAVSLTANAPVLASSGSNDVASAAPPSQAPEPTSEVASEGEPPGEAVPAAAPASPASSSSKPTPANATKAPTKPAPPRKAIVPNDRK